MIVAYRDEIGSVIISDVCEIMEKDEKDIIVFCNGYEKEYVIPKESIIQIIMEESR